MDDANVDMAAMVDFSNGGDGNTYHNMHNGGGGFWVTKEPTRHSLRPNGECHRETG